MTLADAAVPIDLIGQVFIPLLLAALTLAASWGLSQGKVKNLESKADKLQTTVDQQRERDTECAKSRNDTAVLIENLRTKIERNESDVKEARQKADAVSDKLSKLEHLPEQMEKLSDKFDKFSEKIEALFRNRKD